VAGTGSVGDVAPLNCRIACELLSTNAVGFAKRLKMLVPAVT